MDEFRNSGCPAVIGRGGINRCNAEGYQDSTAYEALCNICREEKAKRKAVYKPMVYICSPYSGDTQHNTDQARKYSRFAYKKGAIPMTPHLLYPQFMFDENPEERRDAMHFNYVLLGNCSELWVFGSRVSEGMAHEIGIAKKRKVTIRWFNESREEVPSYE